MELSDAGAVVLLGLGCLAAEFTDVAEQCRDVAVEGQAPSVEQEISSGFNVFVDLAAIHTIIVRARIYLDQSRGICNAGSLSPVERVAYQEELEGFALHSPIYTALMFVQFFKILAGFLSPYPGDSLQRSSAQLTELHDLLGLASSNELWTGVAAEGHQSQVSNLQSLVEKLASCDKWLAAYAQHQADIVLHTRLALGVLEGLLIVAADVESGYYLTGEIGEAFDFAERAALIALMALLAILLALPASVSVKPKAAARHAFHVYQDVSDAKMAGCVLDSLTQPAVPETGIADFEVFFAGMPPLSESEEAPATTPAGRFAGPAASANRDLALANGLAEPSPRPAFRGQSSRRRGVPARRPGGGKAASAIV
ncbi:MAG: hypothetical protein K2X31_04545, partial [Sphingopyxis sp.]|nr:hypothetical protein [Sphingopyxis sp.]